jgi:hypothetical protein
MNFGRIMLGLSLLALASSCDDSARQAACKKRCAECCGRGADVDVHWNSVIDDYMCVCTFYVSLHKAVNQ